MAEALIGAVVSVLTGLGLWAVLPRGVVLTRSMSQQKPGTWELRNDSALPVRLTSVTVEGAITYNEKTGKIEVLDLPPEYLPGDRFLGAKLAFVDPATENLRTAYIPPWRGQMVPPGDMLRAAVMRNARLQDQVPTRRMVRRIRAPRDHDRRRPVTSRAHPRPAEP